MKRIAINANGNTITSFAGELSPTGSGEYLSLSLSLSLYIYIYIYIYICVCVCVCVYYWLIGLVARVFASWSGRPAFDPRSCNTKDYKNGTWYLKRFCLTLSNIRYVSRVKWSNPGKGVAASPTPRCCSYLEGNLLVALDYGRQLYFSFIYI